MNYTPNHHLPQWVESDRVRMEDFNAAMSSIDSGLTNAVSKANAAQAAAQEAKNTAADPAKPYVVGSYTGNGQIQLIEIGFKPAFLIISGMKFGLNTNSYEDFDHYFALTGQDQNLIQRVQLLNDGFAVYPMNNYGASYPTLNEKDRLYSFIAFR